jgi:ATP-dependent RNA helicase RhlE
MIQRGFLKLHHVEYLVLDEADRMLDMGFSEDVEYIRGQCTNMKQLMSFSATVTHELKDMLDKYIGSDYNHIEIAKEAVSDKINHMFIKVARDQKLDTLVTYLSEHKDQKVLIFTQTKM